MKKKLILITAILNHFNLINNKAKIQQQLKIHKITKISILKKIKATKIQKEILYHHYIKMEILLNIIKMIAQLKITRIQQMEIIYQIA